MSNEYNFKKWWLSNGSRTRSGEFFSENTKQSYLSSLNKISKLIYKNIFEIDDIKELNKILDRLEYGDLRIQNDRTNKAASNALKQYIKFLQNTIPLSNNHKEYKREKKAIIVKNSEYKNNNNIHIKNIILYGPPGVGKTHNINKLIKLIEENKSQEDIFKAIQNNDNFESEKFNDDLKSRVKFVTFHQSFGYEDFIEGFRPNKKGKIKLEEGIFKIITLDAKEDKNKYYYLIIDEINRGNISKIFGELITLIEESKRDNLEVTLPYSKEPFRVPSNLFIIGTMNSTDKSIALIDIALRRRFTFLKMEPNEELVADIARDYFIKLNSKIEEKLGSDFKIGHSYFMDIKTQDDLEFVKSYKIKPLLEEYFYGDSESLKDILEQIQ